MAHNNMSLLDTLKALPADPTRAVELYRQLYGATFLTVVQRGSESSIESARFLTYVTPDGLRELPVFTARDSVLTKLADDAVLMELTGPVLWRHLLNIIQTGKCEAAIDPGQPHGIRLKREMILGMVSTYGA